MNNTATETEGAFTEYIRENDREYYEKYIKYKRKYKALVAKRKLMLQQQQQMQNQQQSKEPKKSLNVLK